MEKLEKEEQARILRLRTQIFQVRLWCYSTFNNHI
jgi:hypothetical protein